MTSPELDLAHIETYLALSRREKSSDNEDDSSSWQQKALAMAEAMGESHGAYWRRRADALLAESAAASSGVSFELLAKAAENHYLKQRHDQAVAAFVQASQTAQSAGRNEQAFELLYKAALVERKRGRHREAAGRFRQTALAFPQHKQAAGAHLWAIWSQRQLAESDSQALSEYQSLLEEHLDRWPQASTSDRARLWLGMLYEHQNQWSAALEAYTAISPDAEQFASAAQGAARCWPRRLAELSAAEEKQRAAAAASEFLLKAEQQLTGNVQQDRDLLVAFSAAFRAAPSSHAIELARVLLKAVEPLQNDISTLDDPAQTVITQAHAEALAVLDRREEASALYEKLAARHPQNGALQVAYAEFLVESDRAAGLRQWRRVASKSRPGSQSWLKAKLAVAELELKQGNRQQAEQLVRYILATQPGLSTEWRERFEKLIENGQ